MSDTERNVRAAVERRLRKISNKQAMSESLSTALAERLTPWLLEKGLVKINEIRISFTPAAKLKLDRLGRKVRWMENSDRHHGQEAGGCARKALRSISHRHVTCEKIFELADKFGQLRKKAIDSNGQAKPFATPWKCDIGKTGVFAKRLTCASDVSRIGHAMGNCLANPEYGPYYVDRARRGEVELVALHNKSGEPVALLSIAENSVEGLKGPNNCRPWRYRSKLLILLAQTEVRCGDCTDAAEVAICDELLHAKANGSCKTFRLDGIVCDLGLGFLAMAEGQYSVLLQDTASGLNVSAAVGTDDGDVTEVRRYLQKRLRQLCRYDANLAAACNDAFPGIDVVTRTWHRAAK